MSVNNTKANIFKIQRYCITDGPGIRTTVFFKGCPLSCQWCHNPESRSHNQELMFDNRLCVLCGRCEVVCPNDVHSFENDKHHIDYQKCLKCGACVDACLNEALSIVGYEASVDEIMSVILKDEEYYKESNGGVTISGGEALLQPDIVISLANACKEHHISTYLDTSGMVKTDKFLRVAENVDGILYDLKIIDSEKHKKWIGSNNELILENFKQGCKLGKNLIVRNILMPGINDEEEDIQTMIEFLKQNNFSGEVHLLPYHRYGTGKYHQLGMIYELNGLEPPDPERVITVQKMYQQHQFKVAVQ